MKEKLEFKYLVPYLSYELKFVVFETKQIIQLNANHIFNNHNGKYDGLDKNAYILLLPLSNLRDKDKQGEFIHTNIRTIEEIERVNGGLKNLRYSTFEFLVSKHFDVFGLIEKGLAIDINTI